MAKKEELLRLIRLGRPKAAFRLGRKLRRRFPNDEELAVIFFDIAVKTEEWVDALESVVTLYPKVKNHLLFFAKALSIIAKLPVGKASTDLIIDKFISEAAERVIYLEEENCLIAIATIFEQLVINKESSQRSNDYYFSKIIVPLMEAFSATEKSDVMLYFELRVYESLIKQDESENRFVEIFTPMSEQTKRMGQRIAQTIPKLDFKPKSDRVAFIVLNASTLAHVEAMLNVFEGINLLDGRRIEPNVIVLQGFSQQLQDRLDDLGVAATFLDRIVQETSITKRLISARSFLQEKAINVSVWLSTPVYLPFASAIRMAPIQTWWSMKYHGYKDEAIDYYLAANFRSSNPYIDETWLEGFLTINKAQEPSRENIESERKKFGPNKLILGTIARDELIARKPFLHEVARLLNQHPHAVFVWTGRTNNQKVIDFFKEHQLEGRHFFVGWVDVYLYSHVIDVYLDTFPYFTGFTLINAMRAKTPVVLTKENPLSLLTIIDSLLSKFPGYLNDDEMALWAAVTKMAEDYNAFASSLIQSEALSQNLGNLNRKIIDSFFTNRALSSSLYNDNFIQIIEQN